MDDRLLIIGAGVIGIKVLDSAYNGNSFFVDDKLEIGSYVHNHKVVGHVDDLENLREEYEYAVVAINDPHVRKHILDILKKYNYEIVNIIHSSVKMPYKTKIGVGNILFKRSVIKEGVTIGDGNILFDDLEVEENVTIGNFNDIFSDTLIGKDVVIGNSNNIGSNCYLAEGVSVGDYEVLVNCTARMKK